MTARPVQWEGQPLATLLDGEDGLMLVEPIVVDPDGGIIMGAEVLEASRRTGVSFDHVQITDCTPEFYQEIRRRLVQARDAISAELGRPVSLHLPDD